MNRTKITRSSFLRRRFWGTLNIVGLIAIRCGAHDQPVHMAIAESAVLSSDGVTRFLSEASLNSDTLLVFQPALFGSGGLRPISWVTNGAYQEDVTPRFGNHFYTLRPESVAGRAFGMTDWHESLVVPGNTTNSYAWATDPNRLSPFVWPVYPSVPNTEGWRDARTYQYSALTAANRAIPQGRDWNMAHMFYALGHVLHLNEDLSQPDHVRNDEHFISWHRFIENFGSDIYRTQYQAFPTIPHGWAYWQSQGFSSLLDFWDRGIYRGDESALEADAYGSVKLGMAEFSNGNFLGEDATYAEFFGPDNIHYFPLPSLADTTQPQLRAGHITQTAIDTVALANHHVGDRVYLQKTGAGIQMRHHSALNYFAVRNLGKQDRPGLKIGLTINDTNVLQEYHQTLIPKAIEYSAGILDYFFRGRLSVTPSGSTTPGNISLQIQNLSGQGFQGGTFRLYSDDGATPPVRSEVASFTTAYSGSLADQATTTGEFTRVDGAANYVLVYQGSIGTTDPIDADIAIAAANFPPPVFPNWNGIVWDFIEAQGIGSGSATFDHDLDSTTFRASVTLPVPHTTSDVAAVLVHGRLLFSGALTHCTITFNRTTDPGFGNLISSRVRIAQTIGGVAVDVFNMNTGDIPQGVHAYPFVIQAGVNSLIQIGGNTSDFNDPNNDEGAIMLTSPYNNGTDRITAIISNL